jgi:hypothetical protein
VLAELLLSAVFSTNTGPSDNRVDIIFAGDGYTQADIDAGVYQGHVNGLVDYMFGGTLNADPFSRYRNFFNIHAIEVVSNESGADIPSQGIWRDTAFNGRYGAVHGLGHSMSVNTPTVGAVVRSHSLPAYELMLVPVNDTLYGGTAYMPGGAAVYAAGNPSAHEIALHEIGHSFAGLVDEYGGNEHPTWIPYCAANISMEPTGSKWAEWLGYEQEGIGVIGSYEGGLGANEGTYRPSELSKMRAINHQFDAIAREAIILAIYNYVDPFDYWWSDGSVLYVEPVDDEVIDVEWYVDGVLAASGSNSFDLGHLTGTHTITARGYDPTPWVRRHRDRLEQTVEWRFASLGNVPEPSSVVLLATLASCLVVKRPF